MSAYTSVSYTHLDVYKRQLHTTWILLLRLYIKNSRVNFLVGNLLCKPLAGAVLSQKCGRAVPVFGLCIDPD